MGSGQELKHRLEQLTPSSNQIKLSEQSRGFEDVGLTDEETAEALRGAREIKYFQMKRIGYMQELNKTRAFKEYTFEELWAIVEHELTIDEYNKDVIRLVCLYVTRDERFELEGYSLTKGICLFGGVGVGKTTLLKMVCRNQHQSYIMKMCREVEDEFSQSGDVILKQYGISRQAMLNSDPFGHQILGYCFDDLGTEPIGKYYGKEVNVMTEIILNRYDRDIAFNQTHLTTNLSVDDIRQRYGTRVTDRMRQMFNLITYPESAKSRRT